MWSAALAAIVLIVAGLWAWQGALELSVALGAARPEIAVWAVRSAGAAAWALAQVLIVHFLCQGFYERAPVDRIMKWGCGGVCILASLIAVGLSMLAEH